MPVRATSWISQQSWWWVFALFIAVPAVALALLGLTAIRADAVERGIPMREQQDQLARVAEAALATAFDREMAAARTSAVRDPGDARAADVLFEIETAASSRIVVSALTSAKFEIWTLDGLMNTLNTR
jgi:hypothetical protein